MKVFSFCFVFFLAGLFAPHAQSQGLVQKSGDCSGFHENACKGLPNGFERNGQSKSALFAVGDTSELKFVAYKGHDYRIDICQDQEVFSNEVRFRILDTKMEKEVKVKKDTSGITNTEDTITSYTKVRDELYNNKNDDNSTSLEFSNPEKTRRLIIQVIALGESTKSDKLKSRDMGCIGVSVGHAPTRDRGFN